MTAPALVALLCTIMTVTAFAQVYDIAEKQELAKPVEAYQRAEAERIRREQVELQNERLRMENERRRREIQRQPDIAADGRSEDIDQEAADLIKKLETLAKLREAEILTEEEHNELKSELLQEYIRQ